MLDVCALVNTKDLFAPDHTLAWPYLAATTYPWEVIPRIAEIICAVGATLDFARYDHPAEDVWIARSATVAPTAYIGSCVIIGEDTEVRHGAFIRGAALIGNGCVVGNSTELKNVILSDGVQVPHYNYVGDSVLGYKAHMGAGAITSNVKSDKSFVVVKPAPGCPSCDGLPVETGLKKCGAILGDEVEVGCGSVLNPGTVVGARTSIYPLSSVRGILPPDCIFKSGQGSEIVRRS